MFFLKDKLVRGLYPGFENNCPVGDLSTRGVTCRCWNVDRFPFFSHFPYRIVLAIGVWVGLMLFGWLGQATAQIRDDFEAGRPRFRLWRDDAAAKVVKNELITTMPHTGVSSEMVEVSSGYGKYIHIAYPIDRCAIIDELTASLWIRCASRGMRPAFRVVFPRTAHPATSQPLTTLLYGKASDISGEWNLLEVNGVVGLYVSQQRVIRTQYGAAVDLRDAYIDAVIIDIYNGPGNTKIQVDDLSIEGMVAPNMRSSNLESTSPSSLVGSDPFNRSEIRANKSLTLETIAEDRLSQETAALRLAEQARDIRASVPRWIQYRGESLDWLATLGFSGVVLDQPPTTQFLTDARNYNLGVIAPPPDVLPTSDELESWQAVQSWALGWALDHSQIETSRQSTVRLNRLPLVLQRPSLVEAMESYGTYSRIADLLAVPIPLATTLRDSSESERILQASIQPLRGRTIPLASIMLEPLQEWVAQRESIAQAIDSTANNIEPYDRTLARLHVMRSIGHGVRGWYFRSLQPLDAGESVNLQRADSFRAIAAELGVLAPWIQSGEPATSVPMDAATGFAGYRIVMPRSQLVMLVAKDKTDSMIAPSVKPSQLTFTLPRHEQTTQAYRISRGQLESLNNEPTPEGWKVTIPSPTTVEMIVVTEDARAIGYLQRKLAEVAPTLVESRVSAAEQSLQILQMSLVAERIPQRDPAWRLVSQAQSNLRASTQHLSRGDIARSIGAADQASALSQSGIRASWERAMQQFPAPQCSPLTVSALGLPLHWELNRTIANRPWRNQSIPSGDMNDFELMKTTGWTSHRRLEDRVASSMSFVSGGGPDGSGALLVQAQSVDGLPTSGGYAGASMRIQSPSVPLTRETLVHVEALVRVLECTNAPQAGLLVYDSQGGSALGQLVNLETGDANTWQRVSLYRMMTRSDDCRISFELRGEVKAMIDQVRIETMLPKTTPQYPLIPVQLNPRDEVEMPVETDVPDSFESSSPIRIQSAP